MLIPASIRIPGTGGFGGTLTYQDITTTTGSATLTIPAGASAGDVVIAINCAYNGSSTMPTDVTPTGFTPLAGSTGSSAFRQIRVRISGKVLVGGDPGASITGMAADTSNIFHLIRYSVSGDTATTLTANSVNTEATGADPASQSVTSGSGAAPLICVGSHMAQNSSDLGTSAADFGTADVGDGTDQSPLWGWVQTKVINSSPSNQTWDADDKGFLNVVDSLYVEVS